jgi:hypothetical protein
LKEKILKFWRDPVWSKVISAIIISIGILLYNIGRSIVSKVDFSTVLTEFLQSKIQIWILLVLIIVLLIGTAIFNYFKKDKPIPYSTDDKSLALDIALFDKIRNDLLNYEAVRWVRTNNFAGFSFYDKYLEPFDKILYDSDAADFEFLNPNLELLKVELINAIKDFDSFLGPNIFSEGNNRLSVPSEWELEQYDRFVKAVDGIHSRAQTLASKYDEFIKEGRKILKV